MELLPALLPAPFHLGWIALLLILGGMTLAPPRVGRRADVAIQLLLAVAVLAWAGRTLATIAADHGPGLEVEGYVLQPPASGPQTLSLGTAAVADVPLADRHADAVHAILRWVPGPGAPRPELWNASAERRLEIDGHGLHDVPLPPGARIRWGGSELEIAASTLWPGVLVRDGTGAMHRYSATPGRGLAATLPKIGHRIRQTLGILVLDDGALVLDPDAAPLPGDGPVARLELRGREPWLTFAGPQDRADHPLLVQLPGQAAVRPADRWHPLRGGEVLTLGYSRFVAQVGASGAVTLRSLGHPTRMAWPGEDAAVLGDVLLAGEVDGAHLSVSVLAEDSGRGFRRFGGVLTEADGGPQRALAVAGESIELPLSPEARVRLRLARRAEPAAAFAGTTGAADATAWRLFGLLALLYLVVVFGTSRAGLLHLRNAGVLHGAAMLFAVGLICLFRLSDPGDPLRAGWVLRQAQVGALSLSLALAALVALKVRARRRAPSLMDWLDGPQGDGAPARWLYVGAVAVLIAQLPFGEAGIAIPGLGSIQPIEIARTLLVVYLAYWTARSVESKRDRLRGHEGLRQRWAYMAHVLPVLAVLGLCYGLDDISPILVFVAFLAVLYAVSLVRPSFTWWPPRAWRDHLGAEVAVAALVLAGVSWIVLADPNGTIARRVAVWWDPWSRGGDAYQAVTALWATASGGVFGLGWTGENGLLPPAVKDDFILALLAARAGIAAVTLLAATFGLLLVSGAQALRSPGRAGTSRAEWERWGILGASALWMLAIQAAVVLGSATGGLPVMGQPLPFVAAAGSHLLFFCLPAVALVLGATRLPQRQTFLQPTWGLDGVGITAPSITEGGW